MMAVLGKLNAQRIPAGAPATRKYFVFQFIVLLSTTY